MFTEVLVIAVRFYNQDVCHPIFVASYVVCQIIVTVLNLL